MRIGRIILVQLSAVIVFVSLAVFGQGFLAEGFWLLGLSVSESAAQDKTLDPANPDVADYPRVGIRGGVWNDGQAALWDLNIFDHFHYFGPENRARGYRPEQPIKFSHVVHVQQFKMECKFCHWNVAKSPYAAIPEVQTCMACHSLVKGKNVLKKEAEKSQAEKDAEAWKVTEIKKIEDLWNAGKQIPWVKVHVMPDHVRFNHKRHVKAGVGCQECHGQISEMAKVERVSSMKMGWCLSCHRERGASIDCYTCHK